MSWSCLFLLIEAHPHRRDNRVSPVAKPADIPVGQPTRLVTDNVYSRRVVRLQRQSSESIPTVPKVSMAEAAERIKLDPRSLNEAVHPENLAHTDSKAVTPINPAAQKFQLLIFCNLLDNSLTLAN